MLDPVLREETEIHHFPEECIAYMQIEPLNVPQASTVSLKF
jgi:hypothetical protein